MMIIIQQHDIVHYSLLKLIINEIVVQRSEHWWRSEDYNVNCITTSYKHTIDELFNDLNSILY